MKKLILLSFCLIWFYSDAQDIFKLKNKVKTDTVEFRLDGTKQITAYPGISGLYTAGTGISISGNTISTNYIAGTGITITTNTISNEMYITDDSVRIMNGTDYVTIAATSGLQLMGNTTVYDDLFFPFNTGSLGGGSYPAFVADSGYYLFSAVDTTGPSKCIMYFAVQLPHRWEQGSRLYPHIHYQHETGTGTPIFKMKYKWTNIGDWSDGTWKWYQMGTTTGTKNYSHQLVYGSGGISGSGKTFSSMLIVQIYLGATSPVNVKALQFDIHYKINRLGTNEEYH